MSPNFRKQETESLLVRDPWGLSMWEAFIYVQWKHTIPIQPLFYLQVLLMWYSSWKLFVTCLLFLAKLLMFQWFDAVLLLYKNATTREISDETDLKLCFDIPQKTPRQILGLDTSESSLYTFMKVSANSRHWLHLFSKLIQSQTATQV